MKPVLSPRLTEPRIAPVEPQAWDPIVHDVLGGGRRPKEFGEGEQPVYNVFKTLANYPALMKRMAPWGNHLLFKSSLPAREREMVILRTGWRCAALYEWAHHLEIAQEHAGVSEADLQLVRGGEGSGFEGALMTAVDQLLAAHFIDDATWLTLSGRWDTRQLMDLVFTVGHYASMCMALNTFGVQLEPGFRA